MFKDNTYKFECSISVDAYKTKDEVTSCITSRQLAKSYGYKEKMNFIRKTVTSKELLDSCINGSSFCHLFNGYQNIKEFNKTYLYKATGGFSLSAKCDKFFEGSYVIGVDIDNTSYSSPESFISNLSIKPTFYHTTFSNYQLDKNGNNKGLRFRLVYVFDEMIKNKFFFRYVASEINNMISTSIGTTEGIDTANLKCSQYYNGTNINNKELICNYGISNLIYSFKDFDLNKISFKDFLINELKTRKLNNIDKNSINNIILYINNNTTDTKNTIKEQHIYMDCPNETTTYSTDICDDENLIDKRFARDMFNAIRTDNFDSFKKKYQHTYSFIYRVEKSEWIDNIYQKIDNDYFSLYWNVNRVEDGCKRRIKVFERMCLRRVMNPEITIEHLMYCAYVDVERFFSNDDKVFTYDYYLSNATNAMNLSIDEIKTRYAKNISYLQSRKPKSGIILKSKINYDLASRNKTLKKIRWTLISDYYDTTKSVKDNVEIISNNLFQISEKTLKRFCKENNINTNPNKVVITDDEILRLIDLTLSANKNLQLLKDSDIKLDKRRLLKLYKYKKENQQRDKEQHIYMDCPNETTLLSDKNTMILINNTETNNIDNNKSYNGTKIYSTDNHTTSYSISDNSKIVPQYKVI